MLPTLLLGAALAVGQAPETKVVQTPAPPQATATPLDTAAEPEKKAEEEPEPEPDRWFIMRSLDGTALGARLADKRIQIYGHTEASFTASSAGRVNTPLLFQSPMNEFLLNQNWLTIERTVETKDTTDPSFGFRIDGIVPGSDARFVQQRGLLNGQTERAQFDLYQFYVEANFPGVAEGLNVKVGRAAVPYMAEVTPSIGNALFSHSYAYYYNPYTHTGIMNTLKLSDVWSVGAWFTLGNDVFFDPAAQGMFVGVLYWTSPNERDSAIFSACISPGRYDVQEAFSNQDMVDLVYTHKFNKEFKYMLDSGIGWENNIPGIDRANWYWAVNYLSYDFTSKVSGTTRFELFEDSQGFRTGFEGLYTALTAGLTIKPCNAVLFRPELRYDYNNESRPFGDDHGMFTAAADVIVRW